MISGIPDLISSGNKPNAEQLTTAANAAANPAGYLSSETSSMMDPYFYQYFNNRGQTNTAASMQQGLQNFLNAPTNGVFTPEIKNAYSRVAQYLVNTPSMWDIFSNQYNTNQGNLGVWGDAYAGGQGN